MHRVGGHDHVDQVHSIEQDRQPRRFAGLGTDIDLGEHNTVVVVERGEQLPR